MAAPALTAWLQGQTVFSADRGNTFTQSCDTIAQLRGFVGLPGIQVFVRGSTAPNDGGARAFYWNQYATGPDNNATVIVPTGSSSGAWIALVGYPGFQITPELFGAVGNGITDDAAAFNAAIKYLTALPNGGELILGAKKYLNSSNIILSTSNLSIIGQGSGATELIQGTNSQIAILMQASNCTVRGLALQNLLGKTGTIGIGLGTASATAVLITNANYVEDVLYSGLNTGLALVPGAPDSECYYNNFDGGVFENCTNAILFNNPSAPGNGGANSNNFKGTYIFSAGVTANTGIWILAGGKNTFEGGYIEGMSNGASPLPTPTALYIAQQSSDGFANDGNIFVGINGEGNTRGIDLHNANTEFYGCDLGSANNFAVNPAVMQAASPSQVPTINAAIAIQGNSQLSGLFANNVSTAIGSAGFMTQPGGTGRAISWETVGGRMDFPIIQNTTVGGGTVTLDVPWAYVANAVYEIWAGAYDAGGTQVSYNTRGTYVEGPSGTFTALDPNSGSSYGSYAITAGSPSTSTVTIGRSTTNITVAVDIAKTGLTFTCYAKIQRHV